MSEIIDLNSSCELQIIESEEVLALRFRDRLWQRYRFILEHEKISAVFYHEKYLQIKSFVNIFKNREAIDRSFLPRFEKILAIYEEDFLKELEVEEKRQES